MLTVKALETFGADAAEGLARCFGNEALYLRLVGTVPGEQNFARLQESVAAGDLAAGFEAAHALKGVLANLSLTPILRPVEEITELLRSGTQTDYTGLLGTVEEERRRLQELCES